MPVSVAQTNEQLKSDSMQFNMEKYRKAVDVLLEEHGVLEDGKASERVVDVIEETVGFLA